MNAKTAASAAGSQQAGTRFRFGFDIGGTFTDFVVIDVESGAIHTFKTLTTPHEPGAAVLEGWAILLAELGITGDAIESAVHGTTLITNALIERDGAVTGLVTTQGFRDVLEMRKEMRYDIYDLLITLPEPLVRRPLRLEVGERVNGKGQVLSQLNTSELEEVRHVFEDAGVTSIAVCFLHSFSNSSHERVAGAWFKEHMPAVSVSLSSEVAPEIREYERMSTTVCNAYVQPLAEGYLSSLGTRLREAGFTRNLYLMLSSGGITTLDTASRFPIRLVESGPAAGVLAAVHYGELIGESDLVSFDMGGTTAKMCLIKDGQPAMASTFEIARVHRFKRGSGFPVQVRSIELVEIGAGGGSIARIDDLGLLKVGPASAGAEPGPACYGLGGEEPTVTDGDLLLGYLNPENFLGGRMHLSRDSAEVAVGMRIAEPMGIGLMQAAYGIHQVVNENMIAATRIHVAERGADARRMYLMAFGGAGPVHADAIARALRMRGYVIPASAGVTSALGFLTAPMSFELARSVFGPFSQSRLGEFDAVYAELEVEGRRLLTGAGLVDHEMKFIRQADLRHAGQGHEIVLGLPFAPLEEADVGRDIAPLFYNAYESVYGHAHRHLSLEIVTCRLTAVGPKPTISIRRDETASGDASAARTGSREAYFSELGGLVDTQTFDRALLRSGATFDGPAIVEERDSTAVIGPGAHVVVDDLLNLRATFE